MSTWTYMNIKGQGHSLTSVQGHSYSTFSNFFSLETAGPIEAKFYVEPQWDQKMKVYSNGPGHMTNIATMPIYGKNLKKSSALEPKGQCLWKLVCGIGYSSTTMYVQMMTLGWPWPILRPCQIWSIKLAMKEVTSHFCWNQNFVPGDCLPLPRGYIHV